MNIMSSQFGTLSAEVAQSMTAHAKRFYTINLYPLICISISYYATAQGERWMQIDFCYYLANWYLDCLRLIYTYQPMNFVLL